MSLQLKKSLGQHFLHNEYLCQKIVAQIERKPGMDLLEIGPGGGAITKYLLQWEDVNYKAIEVDSEKVDYLLKTFPEIKGKVANIDFLKSAVPFSAGFSIIGNFPYNISSSILFKILEWEEQVGEVVGMFQKEVAMRVASNEGSKNYGILSVLMQTYYDVKYLFDVAPGNFTPPPKVMSGVLRLRRSGNKYGILDKEAYIKFVKAAFSQRRKTLRNALKSNYPAEKLTEDVFNKRAEQLSVAEFVDLFKYMKGEKKSSNWKKAIVESKILIAADVHPYLLDKLNAKGLSILKAVGAAPEEIVGMLKEVEGIITSNMLHIDKELIDEAVQLKWIGRLGSGMEIIDVAYAASKGIKCFSSPEGNANAVAEQALGMLLGLQHNVFKARAEIQNGLWLRNENRGIEIEGLTAGIIGIGNNGLLFAKKLAALGVTVLAYDKYKSSCDEPGIRLCKDLGPLFQQSDILSFHVPLNEETRYYFDQAFLDRMQKTFVLLNLSRGPVVSLETLYSGMKSGKITGAALDVWENEPLWKMDGQLVKMANELLAMPNFIGTPHIGGYSEQAVYKMSYHLINKIMAEHYAD